MCVHSVANKVKVVHFASLTVIYGLCHPVPRVALALPLYRYSGLSEDRAGSPIHSVAEGCIETALRFLVKCDPLTVVPGIQDGVDGVLRYAICFQDWSGIGRQFARHVVRAVFEAETSDRAPLLKQLGGSRALKRSCGNPASVHDLTPGKQQGHCLLCIRR